ncbi:MAG: CBS domain-containing protein [Bdellovibrionales bacterium]|nr:CBS domain-containing protein [Bdellovibrionales bacterium]
MPLIWSVQGVLGTSFEETLRERLKDELGQPARAPDSASLPPSAQSGYAKAALSPRKRGPALTVADIMTRDVHTVQLETTVAEALRLLAKHRFRHLPVVDSRGALAGMLSDRDLLPRVGHDEYDPVQTHMTARVLVATPDTPLREASGVMLTERIHSLPAVNGAGHMIGILTTSDILRALWQYAPIELWV